MISLATASAERAGLEARGTLSREEREEMRKQAVYKAQAIAEDPNATEEQRRDAREFLSLDASFVKHRKELEEREEERKREEGA